MSLDPDDQLKAFLFEVGPWLRSESTATMSYEEKGVFIDLLAISWEKVGIPKDPVKLARLLGLTQPQFNKIWKTVGEQWEPTGNRLFNPKLEKVRRKLWKDKDVRRIHAKKAAEARWAAEREKNAEAA